YWRMQETTADTTVPGGTVKSETGAHDGTLAIAQNTLPDDPATLSPEADPLLLEIGVADSLVATDTAATCFRVRGALVGVPQRPELNTAQFTIEALVQPEWGVTDPQRLGRYYCVVESSDPPAAGSTDSKRLGFALYAGPEDPSTPNTPYRWQLWVGNGTNFVQVKELVPVPNADKEAPLVVAAPTYVAATFDGSQAFLWVYSADRDIEHVKYELQLPPYVPNTDGGLSIGISGVRRSVIAPFPGPTRFMYPFSGKIQEVAYYDKALAEPRIISHLMSGFIQ
ncbi:MAG: hypothetical protein ABI877_19925, partial [Gemmatimonadaceae bacterium]